VAERTQRNCRPDTRKDKDGRTDGRMCLPKL